MEQWWMWAVFGVVVMTTLMIDLLVFHRKPHAMSLREASAWTGVWVSLAALFAVAVFATKGSAKGLEFVTGYIIEWSLSVDNLFVFLVIFSYFAVPLAFQHRVLFWGIMGAVIMRGIFIAAGVGLLAWFHWMIYVFGAFLVFTGIKILRQGEMQVDPKKNPILRFFTRIMPVDPSYDEQKFFVRREGRLVATALVPVLIVVETTDVMFATDSVPAILAITRDPFIVYTSNVFAILGLRAMFFLLAGIMGLFRYLKVGLCIVLMFVGAKMLISDFYKIPIGISLAMVVAILASSVLASIIFPPAEENAAGRSEENLAAPPGGQPGEADTRKEQRARWAA
ncbi:MAG: Integral rane protein TerC, tellurite resistance protein TerC [candidate division NC10 bacterium]|nr:Integral rane protein TerC, tellurite resistance protein TerC [candidate division NC10 bacterium]